MDTTARGPCSLRGLTDAGDSLKLLSCVANISPPFVNGNLKSFEGAGQGKIPLSASALRVASMLSSIFLVHLQLTSTFSWGRVMCPHPNGAGLVVAARSRAGSCELSAAVRSWRFARVSFFARSAVSIPGQMRPTVRQFIRKHNFQRRYPHTIAHRVATYPGTS